MNGKHTLELAKHALIAYQCKQSTGFLTAVLAFSMETKEFPIDFYNEYSLTTGRSSLGSTLFKNAMVNMVEKSKKVPTKPDVSDALLAMKIPQVYNIHSTLNDKSIYACAQLQSEINSDDAAIFSNKKYKEIVKLAQQ
jgi:hypothetical protein